MFSSIVWPGWGEIFNGELTFSRLGEIASGIFSELFTHENFTSIFDIVKPYLQQFAMPAFAVLAALSFVFALFGKKLLPLAKRLAFFFVGFLVGACIVAPLLGGGPLGIMTLAIGAVCGVVLTLLAKPLYTAIYIVAFAYSAYMIFMGGQLLPESVVGFTKGNMIISLVVVCVTIVLVVLLRKLVEAIGTSILGGYLFALCIGKIVDAVSIEANKPLFIAVVLFVALLGCLKQLRVKKGVKTKEQKDAGEPKKEAPKEK